MYSVNCGKWVTDLNRLLTFFYNTLNAIFPRFVPVKLTESTSRYPYILIKCAESFVRPTTEIFSLSLANGVFPGIL